MMYNENMVQKLINFIKYHNAFTIILGVVFLGFGASYAASPAVRESVYSSKETVVSVDNGLVVSTDLDNFNFNLRINSITEDEISYYVVYSYQTLTIEDNAWQNTEMNKTLTVKKEALDGKDLGLYVAEELKENVNSERFYLKRVQKIEKEKGESHKIVSVEYSGLIGKLLNPKEEVIEGYIPVVSETPIPTPEITVAESIPNGGSPIFVYGNPESQPSPNPLISDSTVEATTSAPSPTPTPTSSPAVSESPAPSPSTTPLVSPTLEPTPASSSLTPAPSVSPTPTPELTPTPTPEPTLTPIPTPTPTPTVEPPIESPTPEPSPSESPIETLPTETPIE